MEALEAIISRAAPGSIVAVPAGTYVGNLRIRVPIVLDGQDQVVLDGAGKGTVVEILSSGVTFRRFTVRGSGKSVTGEPAGVRISSGPVVIERNRLEDTLFGIDLRESSKSIVRGNSIRGKDLEPGRRGDGIRLWWSHDCVVEDNSVQTSRDIVFWYSENLHVAGNHVSGSRYGLHFMYSHNTELVGNELTGNSVGVYLMYSHHIRLVQNRMSNNRGASGYGVGLKDCDDIVVLQNALVANRVGLYVDNSPSSVDSKGSIASNWIAFNEIGLLATPITHDNVVAGNAFMENGEQAASHGRGQLNANVFAADGLGNFWSDYAGFDRDGDGVGDLAYQPRSLFGALLQREPNLRVLVHSPAQQAIEFTARALPELRPEPTLVDPRPMTRPPAIDLPMAQATSDGLYLAGASLGLLGAALLGILTLGRQGGGRRATTHTAFRREP